MKGENKMKEVTVMTTSAAKLKNKQLAKTTEAIKTIENRTKKSMWKIAALLKNVRDKELFKDDGYKNTAEYAEVILGYKKSTVSNMITIAERFLTPEGNLLPVFDGQEYSLSQLQEMLPIKDEKITETLKENKISADTTVASIRKVVKGESKLKNKPKAEKGCAKSDIEKDITKEEIKADDKKEKQAFIKEEMISENAKALESLANAVISFIDGTSETTDDKNNAIKNVHEICKIFAETVNALK